VVHEILVVFQWNCGCDSVILYELQVLKRKNLVLMFLSLYLPHWYFQCIGMSTVGLTVARASERFYFLTFLLVHILFS
jgi:hypothetical protein